MFKKNGKKYYKILFMLIPFVLSAAFIIVSVSLPKEIHLIEGQEHDFCFNLPLQADIIEENIGVINVNNEPIEGNIHLSLQQPFSVKTSQKGSAQISLSLFGLIPVKTVSAYVLPNTEVVAGGMAVGVTMNTQGVMVLGTGYVNQENDEVAEPAKGILKSGDLILEADGKELKNKEDLIETVEEKGKEAISFTIKREGEQKQVEVTPVESKEDNCFKIGVWVRDSTQGIGTITYFNPDTHYFGALGHGVYDIDTKQLMSIKNGNITQSEVTGIKKGEKGVPGELMGDVDKEHILGNILYNTEHGLYGKVNEKKESFFSDEKMPIALQQDVQEGKAIIRTNITGNKIEEYEINIESVNRFSSNASKGMVIKITDPKLLEKTGGIVQGMSGSPIIQNGKLIGAVTHVFVQDPTKGYGIFIENMLKEEQNAA